MGRFAVDFEVTNNIDVALSGQGHLSPERVRRATISGIVDPGRIIADLKLMISPSGERRDDAATAGFVRDGP